MAEVKDTAYLVAGHTASWGAAARDVPVNSPNPQLPSSQAPNSPTPNSPCTGQLSATAAAAAVRAHVPVNSPKALMLTLMP
jgi:hypothetical protein